MGNNLKFAIRNEMQTREWFAANCGDFGYSIVLSQSSFPDYVLEDIDGNQMPVEIESESENFNRHGHDAAGCEFVVCWQHTGYVACPVLELSTGKRYAPNEAPPPGQVSPRTHKPTTEAELRDALGDCREDVATFLWYFWQYQKVERETRGLLETPRAQLDAATVNLERALALRGQRKNNSAIEWVVTMAKVGIGNG